MAKETLKVKVALVGPCESGKTLLANFLADATETTIEEYQPTKVARALEFETVIFLKTCHSMIEAKFFREITCIILSRYKQGKNNFALRSNFP